MPGGNPLGKIYTMGMVTGEISQWLKDELQQVIEAGFLISLVNLAVFTHVESLPPSEQAEDYGLTANVSDASSSVTTSIVTGASYTNSTRTISKNAHGLTNSSIGKRIALWSGTSRAGIAEISSITNINSFVISKAFGADIAGTLSYAVLSFHSALTIDLSPYKLSGIRKVSDSINKEVIKTQAIEFENLHREDNKQNKIYYFRHGQSLFLYVGLKVKAIGDLTLFYITFPDRTTDESSFLDIRDKYVSKIIQLPKSYCYEHLGIPVKEAK